MENETSFSALIQSDKLVLVDFSAVWCGPCKIMGPILKEVKQKLGDAITIITVDVDKNPAIAGHYQITGVPTLILFQEGKTLWRQSGVIPGGQLLSILQKYTSSVHS